jgi:hypothetical protein
MGDNQIVTRFVNVFKKNHLGDSGSIGERMLVKIDNKDYIFEYDGEKWNEIEENNAKYIYIVDRNDTVIYYQNNVFLLNNYFICSHCKKVINKTSKYNQQEICIHCYFNINYHNPNRSEYDREPLTIGKYIHDYEKNHNVNFCSNKNCCFLCDYKNGKILCDIKDSELIYKNKLIDIVQKNNSIEFVI